MTDRPPVSGEPIADHECDHDEACVCTDPIHDNCCGEQRRYMLGHRSSEVRCLQCYDDLRLDDLPGHLYVHGIKPPWEAEARATPPSLDVPTELREILDTHGYPTEGGHWYARSAGDWILRDIADLADRLTNGEAGQ